MIGARRINGRVIDRGPSSGPSIRRPAPLVSYTLGVDDGKGPQVHIALPDGSTFTDKIPPEIVNGIRHHTDERSTS